MPEQKPGNAETGKYGEELATQYLLEQGYSILERNWRYKRSEIDIIAQKNDLLIFVEVKTKRSIAFGYPEEAVDERKSNKVMEGAEQFVYDMEWLKDIRFDVISIQLTSSGHKLKHFEDAFS